MPRSLALALILHAACADSRAQSDPMPLVGAQWIPDGGAQEAGIFAADSGMFDYSFQFSQREEVRINRHDKRVTITRDGVDAGWVCRIEGEHRAP